MSKTKLANGQVKYLVLIEDQLKDIYAFNNAFNEINEKAKDLKLILYQCVLPETGKATCKMITINEKKEIQYSKDVMKSDGESFFINFIKSLKAEIGNNEKGKDIDNILFIIDLGLQGEDKPLTDAGVTLIYNLLKSTKSPFKKSKYLCITQNDLGLINQFSKILGKIEVEMVKKPDIIDDSEKSQYRFYQEGAVSEGFVKQVEQKLKGNGDEYIVSIKKLLDRHTVYNNLIAEILFKIKY